MIRRYFSIEKIIELSALAVLLMSAVRFLSYLYGEHAPASWFGVGGPMALSSSLCFLLIAVCLLLILHRDGRGP